MKNKLLFSVLVPLLFSTLVSAQRVETNNVFRMEGTILDASSGSPLANTVVQIAGQPLWAVSDAQGRFEIPNLREGRYTYEASRLGFQHYTGVVDISPATAPIIIRLVAQSLALDEVVVTATESKRGSTSLIDNTAIRHVQAKTLADVLQLIPGNLTQNPQLADAGQAYIREIDYNVNNALGVGIVVDGAPLSNDANMQLLSLSERGINVRSSENSSSPPKQNVSGRGVDLRNISPDNVESVEVIRGIASAEYGNLTSGAMIVTTRAGRTPWEIKGQADAKSKMFYAGKGFDLGANRGAINVSADYSEAYADIRKKFIGFERVTATLGYSNTFMRQTRPLTLNFRASFYSNINDERQDPSITTNEYFRSENSGIRLTLGGRWRLNTALLSNLEYNVALNASHQSDKINSLVIKAVGTSVAGTAYETGEYESFFTPASYYSEYSVDGRPVEASAKLKLNRVFQFASQSFTTITLGGQWDYAVNNGQGVVFDIQTPPSADLRNRPFNSIPAMNTFAVFAENKLGIALGTTYMTLVTGVRATRMVIDRSVAQRGDISVVEPRITADYRILSRENNTLFDDLTLVGGFGLSSKLPTMAYLYPDNAYMDVLSLAYLDNENDQLNNFGVMTTDVVGTTNPELKPTTVRKWELGLFANIKGVRFNATYFNEHYRDEFNLLSQYYIQDYRLYDQSALTSPQNITYRDGNVYYYDTSDPTTELQLGYEDKQRFTSYLMVQNNGETFKRGVEYSISLPEWRSVRTSLTMDGSYLRIKRGRPMTIFGGTTGTTGVTDYPYRPIYPAGIGSSTNTTSSSGATYRSSRFHTNFRFVTHIPQLRMVLTTTAQVIWMESQQYFYTNLDGEQIYYWGQIPGSTTDWAWLVDPIAYVDFDGTVHPWTAADRDNPDLYPLIARQNYATHFDKEKLPIRVTFNFRLTKELGDVAEISVIANNFLSTYKKFKRLTSTGYYQITDDMYFGAEVKLKF